jgi:hypothetical protein
MQFDFRWSGGISLAGETIVNAAFAGDFSRTEVTSTPCVQ